MIRTYLLNVGELENINYDESSFSERRRKSIERFKREEDKKLSAAAELLLIYALKQFVPELRLPLEITEDEKGRPEISSDISIDKKIFNSGRIYFNISHSKDYSICSISDETVGVDIEYCKVNSIPKPEAVLYPKEAETLAFITNPSEKNKYFFECWTLKESYLKNLGIGLEIRPREFMVTEDFIEAPGRKLKKRYVHCLKPGEIKNADWKFDMNYKVSVCSMKKDADFKAEVLTAKDFAGGITG